MDNKNASNAKANAERPWPGSIPPKLVDVRKLLQDLPALDALDLVCDTEPLRGGKIRVAWEGNWEVEESQFQGLSIRQLSTVPTDLTARASVGELQLSNVLATTATGNRSVAGVATEVSLRCAPISTPASFRCYIAADPGLGKLCYPEFLRDEVKGREWCGLLALELDQAPIDCFFVDEGPYFICEAAAPYAAD